MAVNTVPVINGSRIYIGTRITRKATMTATDFSGQSWTEIGGWTNRGTIGDSAQEITTDVINEGRTVKSKGTRNAGNSEHQFLKMVNDAGQVALRAAEGTCCNYAFKIVDGADCCENSAVVTISNASPGVVTWTAHGLSDGDAVVLSTTGTLPTGLTAGTTYYVTGSTTNSFSLAATAGGTAINTTGAGTGIHTATAIAEETTQLFAALVMSVTDQGGAANTAHLISTTLSVNSNIVTV